MVGGKVLYAHVPAAIIHSTTSIEKTQIKGKEANVAVTPAGKVSKVIVTGVVVDAGETDKGIAYVRIHDGTGQITAFAGKFTPELKEKFAKAESGAAITVIGQIRKTDSGVFINAREAQVFADTEVAITQRAIWLKMTYNELAKAYEETKSPEVAKALEAIGKVVSNL